MFRTGNNLKLGTNNSGTSVFRTLIRWDWPSSLTGTDILSATLNLWENDALAGCSSPTQMNLFAITSRGRERR